MTKDEKKKITVTLPKEILKKLDMRAERCDLSRSMYLSFFLRSCFEIFDNDLKLLEKIDL